MKKVKYILAIVFLTISIQAQNRPQPKPGPAPVVNIGKPETFTLKNGLKVLVVENHKLPRVSFSLTLDNAPYAEGNKSGVSSMTSALMGSGTKKMSNDAFNEEVDFLGASIRFSSQSAYGSGLSKYSDRILELMADGALNPVFTQEEFDKKKAQMVEGIKSNEKSVTSVAARVNSILTYGKDHPNGEYVSEETLNNVTLADVKENYNTYFIPSNAYLVVIGDVQTKDIKKQVEKLFGSWRPAKAPNVSYSDPKDVQYTQINFVDMPNAVQSEISVVNIVNLKKTDKEYFAALLANQILGGGSTEARLNANLRETHGWTYGAGSSIGSGKYVSDFSSSVAVRNSVTDSTIVEIFKELRRIRTELVSEEELKNAKAVYIGNFVMSVQDPGTVASLALTTETQNLPADFYENYIKNINAVTAEDIRNAAQKYFLSENSRIVIVGKATEVLQGLEKTKIPIFYFDKFGKPTEKPVANKPLPAGVTVKSIFDNYINAIGGEKALKAVKSIAIKCNGTLQSTPIVFSSKKTSDNKQVIEITAMGRTIMKQVVNGTSGYIEQQGQKMDIPTEELADMKVRAVPFEELSFINNKDIKVTGIEPINGVDAYAVKNGKSTLYYDVKSGYKVAEAREEQGPDGQKAVLFTYYSDYKDVKGIKIPHKVNMNVGVELDLTITEVKINEGITPADFE